MKIIFDKYHDVTIYRTLSYPIYYPKNEPKKLNKNIMFEVVNTGNSNLVLKGDEGNIITAIFDGYLSLPIMTINNVTKSLPQSSNYACVYKLNNYGLGGILIIFPDRTIDLIKYGSGIPIVEWLKGR